MTGSGTTIDPESQLPAVLDRLRTLLATPPLSIMVTGGGHPESEMQFDQIVLLSRWELENVIRLLDPQLVGYQNDFGN